MSSDAAVRTAGSAPTNRVASLAKRLPGVDLVTVALIVVLAGQAVWIVLTTSRGWFYQDDFTFLSQAVHRPLGWGYLSEPVNAHFTPGLRLQFWLSQRFAPFDAASSIVVRVALQATATVLLWRLLNLLVGRRTGVVAVVALYALNPLLLPGTLWYAASANLLPAQIFAILTVSWHVRATTTGRLRYAFGAGLALLIAAACWEKTATISLTLPILSLGYLHSGSVRARVGASLARWRGWLLTIGPLAAFVVYFVANGYGRGAQVPGAGTLARVSWSTWWHSVGPSLFGGPWRWFSAADVFESFSSPAFPLELLAQLAMLLVVLIGVRRTGWRSLLAWSMPVVCTVIGVILVAAGRYATFGALIDRAYTYVFDLALPWAVAAALALLGASPADIATRAGVAVGSTAPLDPTDDARPPVRRGRRRLVAVTVFAIVGSLIASSIVSGVDYVHRWAQNPSERWYTTMRRSVAAAGPQLNLWDTSAPSNVLRLISEKHHISDVLGIAGLSADYDRTDSDPKVIDDHGHIRAAVLLVAAHAMTTGTNSLCNDLVTGITTRTQPLVGAPATNEWFVHLEYFQRRPTTIYVSMLDRHGKKIVPVGGERRSLSGTLGAVNLRLPYAAPRSLRVRSDNATTNLCLTSAVVGYPFPRGR